MSYSISTVLAKIKAITKTTFELDILKITKIG